MNIGKATLVHRLSTIAICLLLICVALLLVQEWRNVKLHRLPPREAGQGVAARSTTNGSGGYQTPKEQGQPGTPGLSGNRQGSLVAEKQTELRPVRPLAQPADPGTMAQKEENGTPTRGQGFGLPDGREMTFGGLTYGAEHKYIHDKEPARGAAINRSPDTRAISIKTTSASLVLWLHCRSPKGSLMDADFISVMDEGGKEGELSNPSAIFNSTESETVGAWEISNFPRRDARIGFRLYSRDSSYKFHRMGEFWAANPAPRKYPVWSPEVPPIIKKVANAEYRFLNVTDDELSALAPVALRDAKRDGRGEWSTSVFKVATTGQPASRWKVESIVLSDATGNVCIPKNTRFMKVGEYLVFSYDRGFWSSETAGKLRAEFVRTSGFFSNEVVTFNGVLLPSARRELTFNAQKAVGSGALRLEQVKHHRPAVRMAEGRWNIELTATLVPETPDSHICIVDVSDETGQSVLPGMTYKPAKGRQSFLLSAPPRAAALNITFGVQKSQFVEFVPALVRNRTLATQPATGNREIKHADLKVR